MWIIYPRKARDADNVSQKNRRCGKWILEKQDMWVMYPKKQMWIRDPRKTGDVDNGSWRIRICG